LAYILLLPCLGVGIFLAVWGWYRYALLGVMGAFTCFTAATVIRQVLQQPVPNTLPTDEFPHPLVRLIELRVRLEDEIEIKPSSWVAPLGELVSEVIESAGRCLSAGRGAYKVCLKIKIQEGKRELSLSYRGRPVESALNTLFDEIDRIPTFLTPASAVSIELWFRVKV